MRRKEGNGEVGEDGGSPRRVTEGGITWRRLRHEVGSMREADGREGENGGWAGGGGEKDCVRVGAAGYESSGFPGANTIIIVPVVG